MRREYLTFDVLLAEGVPFSRCSSLFYQWFQLQMYATDVFATPKRLVIQALDLQRFALQQQLHGHGHNLVPDGIQVFLQHICFCLVPVEVELHKGVRRATGTM